MSTSVSLPESDATWRSAQKKLPQPNADFTRQVDKVIIGQIFKLIGLRRRGQDFLPVE
jgi:hypothetical protein